MQLRRVMSWLVVGLSKPLKGLDCPHCLSWWKSDRSREKLLTAALRQDSHERFFLLCSPCPSSDRAGGLKDSWAKIVIDPLLSCWAWHRSANGAAKNASAAGKRHRAQ